MLGKRVQGFMQGITVSVLLGAGLAQALPDGQALTPPMGWSSWNWFKCSDTQHGVLSTTLILQIADAMVSSGMKDVGYQYINLDDCWANTTRNTSGGLVALPSQFPGGMKFLADEIHKRGLKFGLYSDLFEHTCAYWYNGHMGFPGMWGHEKQDADSIVKWGVDYLKVDYCGANKWEDNLHPEFNDKTPTAQMADMMRYRLVRDALLKAVSDAKAANITYAHMPVYSICEQGRNSPWLWGDSIGHMWRTDQDISQDWASFISEIIKILPLAQYSGPGHWNDPDMLEVGNLFDKTTGGELINENRVHMALWCNMAVPLIAGNDLRNMSTSVKSIITNPEAIQVNQDSLGYSGRAIAADVNQLILAKKMKDGGFAISLVNRSTTARDLSASWAQIGTACGVALDSNMEFAVRDIFAKTSLGKYSRRISVKVPPADVAFLRLQATTGIRRINNSSLNSEVAIEHIGRGIKIKCKQSGQLSVQLMNLTGVVVYRSTFTAPGEFILPDSEFKNGLYVMHVKLGKHIVSKNILVKSN